MADRPERPALLSQEQLRAHALSLAHSHFIAPSRGMPLLPRLEESADRLEQAFQYLSAVARLDPQPVGSEDWLRDNYYVVLDQIREIRRDLPRKYYVQLPKLAEGPEAGYPRVYLLARELVAHTASRLDLETVIEFASAYQEAAPLSIGETWAVPIMLRLALIEELRWLVGRIVATREGRERARKLEVLGAGETPWSRFEEMLQADIQTHGRLSAAYVVELLQWLRDQSSAAAPVWAALQRALDAQGDNADTLLQIEQQREAADQVAMGNAITSMRLLSAIDWPLFFDRVSVVEQIFRSDPADAYAAMDFPTRDRYRHAVEQLSRRSGHFETEVARHVVALAREASSATPHNERPRHVGYYLISGGRFELERQLAYRPTVTSGWRASSSGTRRSAISGRLPSWLPPASRACWRMPTGRADRRGSSGSSPWSRSFR